MCSLRQLGELIGCTPVWFLEQRLAARHARSTRSRTRLTGGTTTWTPTSSALASGRSVHIFALVNVSDVFSGNCEVVSRLFTHH